jgi:hypothetical protein
MTAVDPKDKRTMAQDGKVNMKQQKGNISIDVDIYLYICMYVCIFICICIYIYNFYVYVYIYMCVHIPSKTEAKEACMTKDGESLFVEHD